MDELAGIRMFVRVVEGGSFVAAARGLGVSKSVITKRVKELEERLKAQLLIRSTRRLTLTDAGASYFERCVRIVAELDEAQSAVRSLTVGLTGTLRVSCIASFLAHQLCRDVCHFQQQHPDLIVELHHNDRVYDPIQVNSTRIAARTITTFCRSPTLPSPGPTDRCGFRRSGQSCCRTASG
jgi:DNA-binding transcriptional LysR family regulator